MVNIREIFELTGGAAFEALALRVFAHQATACAPYREYLALLGVNPEKVSRTEEIPFLPVELFKTHRIYSAATVPAKVFTSSTTTGQVPASHYVADLTLYEESFTRGFTHFYGPPEQTALFALLPGYLERDGSSLIYMAEGLIRRGGGGFYLNDHERLLREMAAHRGAKILLGVSYALWELAENHPGVLPPDTIVMETGGMKGHREELPREKFHDLLCRAFGVEQIHSEYGMAELLSQAYSVGGGLFHTPPWMRTLIRNLDDPFAWGPYGRTGGINVIDLANIHSCSFLQTSDLGSLATDDSFMVLGRITGSEIRGCNLLVQ